MREVVNPSTNKKEKIIWLTDSYTEITDKLADLNKAHPEELLYPVALISWETEVSVDDLCEEEECECSLPIISPTPPPDIDEGGIWYEPLEP